MDTSCRLEVPNGGILDSSARDSDGKFQITRKKFSFLNVHVMSIINYDSPSDAVCKISRQSPAWAASERKITTKLSFVFKNDYNYCVLYIPVFWIQLTFNILNNKVNPVLTPSSISESVELDSKVLDISFISITESFLVVFKFDA